MDKKTLFNRNTNNNVKPVNNLKRPTVNLTRKPSIKKPLEGGKNNIQLKTNPVKNGSTSLARKPSFKNPPEIKQTKTSKYRMLLANPLLNPKELGVQPKYIICGTVLNGNNLEKSKIESKLKTHHTKTPPKNEEPDHVQFKTPRPATLRRSLSYGDCSTIKKVSFHQNKTPNSRKTFSSCLLPKDPHTYDLAHKLDEWLKKRGKSLSEFHHLKCFGVHAKPPKDNKPIEYDEENKENIEVVDSSSYDDLKIVITEEKGKPQNSDLNIVAKDALGDLHKLITDGYCREQCEAWLELICAKYQHLEEEPQYWECRAAIEQSRDRLTSAIDCYKQAIIQGAKVQSVDESLDHLLQKFGLLHIGVEEDKGNETDSKNRLKIIQDARNIFKSSIIQFAVQERKLKKKFKDDTENKKKFIATPVRRSTRLSRTAYTSTPGVSFYSSLQDLDETLSQNMEFRHNYALK